MRGEIALKNVLKKCGEWILIPVALVILLFAAIGFLLYLPVDFIRYKRSPYGREVREKYALWKGLSWDVKLYNGIRKAELPINYADGHFLYRETLILHIRGAISYREETGEWIVHEETEGGEGLETTLAAYAEALLAQAPSCERAVFLVDKEAIIDEEEQQEAERSPFILLYDELHGTDAADVLRAWIEAGA